eukprot:XP_015581912.1 transcriptional activator DEMETER isoform X1 [Ricinus communis]
MSRRKKVDLKGKILQNMDSRIHLGEGFSVSQQETELQYVDSWMPVTPNKPIAIRSNPVLIDRHESQLGSTNWQELVGFPSGYVQEMSNYSSLAQHCTQIDQFTRNGSFAEKNRMINHIAGSYTRALLNENVSWSSNSLADLLVMNNTAPTAYPSRTLHRNTSIAERPLIPNLNTPVNSLREFNSGELFYTNQAHCSSSNVPSGHNSLFQMPQYGFPIPYNPNYDLNSPPSIEADAASTVTNSFQFAPIIEQAKKLENQLSALVNFPQGKGSSEERDKQDNYVVSLGNVPNQHNPDKLFQNIVDSASAVISTPFEEPKESCQGSDQVIDLNKTPQQKTPKRRKHRPKVIVEGKPKKTPKSVTPKTVDPNEKAIEKRKYVRKKGQKESTTEHPDSIGETTNSTEKPKQKRKYVRKKSLKEPQIRNADYAGETTYPSAGTAASCRKALNFEMENTYSEREKNLVAQQEIMNKGKETYNLNTGFHVSESLETHRTKSDLQMRRHNGSLLEFQQSRDVNNLTPFMNQISNNHQSNSHRREGAVRPTARKDGQMDNSNGSGRDIDVGMLQHIHAEGTGRTVLPEKTNCKSLEKNEEIVYHSTESVTKIPLLTEGRGYKRDYHQAELTMQNTGNPRGKLIFQEGVLIDDCHLNSHNSNAACPETCKKQKNDGIQKNKNGMPPPVAAVNQSGGGNSKTDSSASTVERNRELLKSYLKSKRDVVEHYKHSVASGQDLSLQHKWAGQNSCIERTGENCNIVPPTPPKMAPQSRDQLQPQICHIDASTKQTMASTQSLSVPSRKGNMLQTQKNILKDQKSTAKRKAGQPAKQKPITIEEIIYRMEHLNLNEVKGEQTAIVPYKGDGALIPYDGFEIIKKRKPRPKVDLDPETERVWKLLMWKEGGEGLEGTDQEKKQWWEEERRVFGGRADSFIARMHLVQGDRRFSKWKGSVVDSVIGVFLTQNVSDHLSSSAFMNLAAKFPLKSMRNRTCERDEPRRLIQEPDIYMLNPNPTIKWHEKLLTPFYNQSSMTPHESIEHRRDQETSCTERTSIVEAHSYSPEEEVLSSQDSFDSSIVQSNGVIRSYSGSNLEAEDPAKGCKHNENHNTSNAQKLEFEEFFSHVSGRSLFHEGSRHRHRELEDLEDGQQWTRLDRLDNSLKGSSTFNQHDNSNNSQLQTRVESSQLYREDSISSWPSSTSKVGKEKDASCTSIRVLQGAENVAKPTTQQYGSEKYPETSTAESHAFLCKQLMHEQSNPQLYHGSQSHEMNKTFQLGSKSIAEPVNLSDAQDYRQSSYGQHVSNIPQLAAKVFDVEERITLMDNKQTDSENNFIGSNSKENTHFTNKANLNRNASKARKAKAESGQKDAVDWDSLRKQVLVNGRKKERSESAMDSLDYEAMRSAHVNEISDTIKERGMNNMLAERIKDFLNRLVREHGSIDLEWLRDVPPDKAKEYLLSIRGLGLKSVECVRLLTLHHLAFPVDTNVGRIAVRLGWVPLQPLPESLQLHLLELYPILESIQKYLWPRLCKLDQRTLYELHYQMITFGKVFCTKSRPNCNACPMRAECRHFASAFASARLALPGPEDKSIVTATVPLTTERSPGIVIDPLPLPPAEDNLLTRRGSDIVSCVPIIEEPATPEQEHTEVIESDIEDIFDEDPDEIPTIKLNMEELTVNLQNYMQANMELQECDMSKALVALNPEAASIPTPKLKNVSRLRTEHQVYELPDSHPLLNRMDKRQPDDPSPYLLAIWTPGETANSIQPPERHCQFQGPDKLCNEQTCFSCNSIRETNSQTVRGTLLIPCRTAMRGSFPLNGTYFQVNEVFADHESSLNPIDVPRAWIWNLPRRMVYFGTSVSTIFKGLSTEGIQYCFWKGFVCVRGFDQQSRAPKPLMARLHFPASKLAKTNNETQ